MLEPTSSRRLKGPALFSPLLKEDESEKDKEKDKGKDKEKGRDIEGEKIKVQINDENIGRTITLKLLDQIGKRNDDEEQVELNEQKEIKKAEEKIVVENKYKIEERKDEKQEERKEERNERKDDYEDDEYSEEEEEAFNPYLFISGLPSHHLVAIKGKICLPPLGSTSSLPRSLPHSLPHTELSQSLSQPSSPSHLLSHSSQLSPLPLLSPLSPHSSNIENNIENHTENIEKNNVENIDLKENIIDNNVQNNLKNKKYTLVLDLDETLVHCSVDPIGHSDLTFPVTFNGTFYQVFVRKRPYLDFFLQAVAKNFEVSVSIIIFFIFTFCLSNFCYDK